MAQEMNWSTKNCTSGQPWATQFATQVRLNWGGKPPPRSMQLPSAQVTIWKQPIVSQVPQSAAQLVHVSYC